MASIRKRNGKWQAQVRREGYPPLTKTFINRRDAETWGRHMEADLDRAALPVDPQRVRNVTLGELVERYAVEVTPRKRSAYAEMSRIRIIRADPIYEIALSRLTPLHVCTFLDRRLQSVTGETARKDGKLIRQVIDIARRQWGIGLGSNPAAMIDLPPPCKPRTRRLLPVEQDRLDAALKTTRSQFLSAAVNLALETGMRRGELLNARWIDLNLDKRVLAIPRTKTDQSRIIPLTGRAISLLKELRASSAASPYLLPTSANALRLAWERLKRRAGLEDFRFHDLRHEAVSRFFEMGLSVPEVALISGHRDPRMLFRYTHLRAADVADKLSYLENSENGARNVRKTC